MPRAPFPSPGINPYHVNARCLNRQWFDVPMDYVWDVMCDYLYFIHHAYEVDIYSFVLMANHFHLLIASPNQNLSQAMQYFMNQTSKALGKRSQRINQIWGSRFGRCEINSFHYALNAYKYIYQNPVRSGAVERVEDYKYSTLPGKLGISHISIPLVEDLTLFSDVEGTLNWLNRPITCENLDSIRKALRRKVFALPKMNKRLNPLESQLA